MAFMVFISYERNGQRKTRFQLNSINQFLNESVINIFNKCFIQNVIFIQKENDKISNDLLEEQLDKSKYLVCCLDESYLQNEDCLNELRKFKLKSNVNVLRLPSSDYNDHIFNTFKSKADNPNFSKNCVFYGTVRLINGILIKEMFEGKKIKNKKTKK